VDGGTARGCARISWAAIQHHPAEKCNTRASCINLPKSKDEIGENGARENAAAVTVTVTTVTNDFTGTITRTVTAPA